MSNGNAFAGYSSRYLTTEMHFFPIRRALLWSYAHTARRAGPDSCCERFNGEEVSVPIRLTQT